jgi:hypothetical protein
MFGKLTWAAIPFDQPIPLVAAGVVGMMIAAVLVYIAIKGWLPYLWREWITSVDHKRIGVMYTLLALVMLLRGFTDAIMMRTQQAVAFRSPGYLPPDHYDQIFSAHGTLMIFFVAMPFVIGLMNFVVPLQLGARDVAFPTLNSVSFWLTATGALLVNISLVVGEFGHRHLADRRQLRHDHPQGSRARHDLYAHADVLLDGTGFESADRRGVPDPDGDTRHAAAGPLPRLPFLYGYRRRQRDDVHEPHLGLGTS